ncbi:hypothetical protein B7494_g245 [Chlorociboria aeruginascens]|nr:hypothetical protein B7494_g245 [Chlorociboria aeruginascens]
MKLSTFTALCTVPLALAGSIGDVAVRGMAAEDDLVLRSEDSKKGSSSSKSSDKIVVEAAEVVSEVIVIWVNNGGGAATSTLATTQSASANAVAATHTVTVGGAAGLVYTPNTIEAAIGDMVIFSFESQNHTATQSAFAVPCVALANGTDSGFMPNINNTVSPAPQVAMQVTVATPIWFYCRQSGHCGKGMTFSINPTANKTQAMFEQMAIAQNGTGSTAVIAGGSSSAAAAATTVAAATSAAAAAATSSSSIVSGTGTINAGGSCDCSCLCGVAAFPNAAVQGVGAFGGVSGAIPMALLEV